MNSSAMGEDMRSAQESTMKEVSITFSSSLAVCIRRASIAPIDTVSEGSEGFIICTAK